MLVKFQMMSINRPNDYEYHFFIIAVFVYALGVAAEMSKSEVHLRAFRICPRMQVFPFHAVQFV